MARTQKNRDSNVLEKVLGDIQVGQDQQMKVVTRNMSKQLSVHCIDATHISEVQENTIYNILLGSKASLFNRLG